MIMHIEQSSKLNLWLTCADIVMYVKLFVSFIDIYFDLLIEEIILAPSYYNWKASW